LVNVCALQQAETDIAVPQAIGGARLAAATGGLTEEKDIDLGEPAWRK
jgi:hypothetical protein